MNDDVFSPPAGGGPEPPVEPLDPVMVADVLETLTVRQEALEHAFDALARRLGATKDGPWSWATLGPTRTRELFTELRDWVDWLTARYDLRGEHHTIAPCWYAHPVAVEELTALMVAWRAAYSTDEAAPSDALINWHDRWLWPTLHRLNTGLRVWAKCTGGTHHNPPAPPAPTATGFTAFLDELTGAGSTPARGHLTDSHMQQLLRDGDAEALLADDPAGPIRHDRTWYTANDDGAGGTGWDPVPDGDIAALDALLQRTKPPSSSHRGEGP